MRKLYYYSLQGFLLTCLLFFSLFQVHGQIVPLDNGSYTTAFPGTDAAGRNTFPQGTARLTGAAASKPIPTNDWWSAKLNNDHVANLFTYPFALRTQNDGLVVTYIPWGVLDNILPVIVGVSGLNAPRANVSDFSDWTVTMDWQSGSHHFEATMGIGMPFLYFEKGSSDLAEITVNEGSVVVSGNRLLITDARNGADFVVFGPTGSTWTQTGNTYTSDLNGQNYWSLAFAPPTATNLSTLADAYEKYAFVFPANTSVAWSYDEATGTVRTEFEVETDIKEGTDSTVLQGLLPHQWSNLAPNSPQPNGESYGSVSVRGGNQNPGWQSLQRRKPLSRHPPYPALPQSL